MKIAQRLVIAPWLLLLLLIIAVESHGGTVSKPLECYEGITTTVSGEVQSNGKTVETKCAPNSRCLLVKVTSKIFRTEIIYGSCINVSLLGSYSCQELLLSTSGMSSRLPFLLMGFDGCEESFCNTDLCNDGGVAVTTAPTSTEDCYELANSGASYRGNRTRTKTGKTCQRWDSQTPHEHSRTAVNYPDFGLVNNYCRNPDGEEAPWCYTTDVNSRWEYCPVEPCQGCFNVIDSGASYRGSVAQTRTGKMCQPWNSQTPHKHTRTPDNYPNSGLTSNLCRNPDGEDAPWCYTTNPNSRWEYCPVGACGGCFEASDSGVSYRGNVSRTKTGKACQRWDSQIPHEHSRTAENYPDSGLVSNYCRNPDGEDAPWCYTTDENSRWEYCPVELCPGCFDVVDSGASYRGGVAQTKTGKMCQPWNSQTPHEHTRTPDNHPNSGLTSNYCRNPDGEDAPWCYTADPNSRWEYCPVEVCGACFEVSDFGSSYRGNVSRTKTGNMCQKWNSQTPHKHSRTAENYPDSGLVSNYCRNPDGEDAPWCYTTDDNSRWEYCPVEACEKNSSSTTTSSIKPTAAVNSTTIPVTEPGCFNVVDSGASYRGSVARTKTGKMCQLWDSQTPHEHTKTLDNHPNSGLTSNFCRNPDGDDAPWCYTTDPDSRWEYCSVEACGGCFEVADSGARYRGNVSRTKTGKTCQQWDSQTPHEHSRTLKNYPDSGLVNNYCRNPDGEEAPWCYTTDENSRWEYCPVEACQGCFEVVDSGASYRGGVAETKTGKMCQPWNSQTPHEHTRTPEKYPNSDLTSNYCRNPDRDAAPWCYTTDPNSRWDYCPVEVCEGCFQVSDSGASYRGTVSHTKTEKICQQWNSQTPHKHSGTPENYPQSGLVNNYCRNPDESEAPWCYTTDENSRWEYCPVEACKVDSAGCYYSLDGGKSYRGSVATTENGRKCQNWDSQSPHKHSKNPENYRGSGLKRNYCRNPDTVHRPWCYTTDPNTRWEFCKVEICSNNVCP